MSKRVRCGACGSANVFSETDLYTFMYGARPDSVRLSGSVTHRHCRRCGFIGRDHIGERQMTRIVDKYKKVLAGQTVLDKDRHLEKLASQVLKFKAMVRKLHQELANWKNPGPGIGR